MEAAVELDDDRSGVENRFVEEEVVVEVAVEEV